jgi:hypothetical protein
MSRPNLNSNDFMGLFRTGLMGWLVVSSITFAQQPTAPVTPAPAPTPGIADPNTPPPIIPQPEATPGVDPSLIQPAPIVPDATTAPAATTSKPKPKKPAAPAAPTFRGTLVSIDKTNMTIVVHGKAKDETLSITSKTRIFADNKPAILSDAKEGENVTVEYHNTKEKNKEALTLRFTGGPGASTSHSNPETIKAEPEKKKAEVKPAAKKSTKGTAAAKKKKKATTPVDSAAPAPADAGVTPLPDTTTPIVPAPGPGTPTPAPGTPGNP